MPDSLTRAQFALQALVAAGHVTQAKVDEALALFPAPAGEPEMPEPDTHCFDDDAGKDVWSHSQDQLRAYGDARAEHARRVAPGYVLVPTEPTENMFIEGMEADCLGRPSIDDDTHVRSIWNAMLRAAAPPQGEQT